MSPSTHTFYGEREKDKLCVWLAVRSLLLLAGASLSIWRAGMDFQENEQAASHQSPVCQASINFRRSYSHQQREGREEGRPTAAVARLETHTQCALSMRIQTLAIPKTQTL